MTCKILRLSALAGVAALALSAATPAWAWYGAHHAGYSHHARYYGYRTHHAVVHRTAYRYGTYTPAIAAPAVAADVVGGAGALASGISGGLFGYPYGHTYPYNYGYGGGATAQVGAYPYYNCAYGYPSAWNPGEYCPPYGYYGAGYYGYPYDYAYDYGSPYYYGGYGYRRGFHRFGYGYRGFAGAFPRAGVTGAGVAPVRTGVTTTGFAATGERFGGFGGAHFAGGGAHFGGGGMHVH